MLNVLYFLIIIQTIIWYYPSLILFPAIYSIILSQIHLIVKYCKFYFNPVTKLLQNGTLFSQIGTVLRFTGEFCHVIMFMLKIMPMAKIHSTFIFTGTRPPVTSAYCGCFFVQKKAFCTHIRTGKVPVLLNFRRLS